MNCRFISPYEAMWRLYEFPIYHREPPVQRLSVHMSFMHNVTFNTTQPLDSIIGKPGVKKIMFTEWMETNKQDHTAIDLTYPQFPTKWT